MSGVLESGMTERQMQVFFEVHHNLPREGPGSRQSTESAYAVIASRLHSPKVLDVGCGPGAQTLCLAELSGGTITAVDNHAPFLEQLRQRAAASGQAERITTVLADMEKLPFEDGTFDLVWAEGSIFIIGVEEGLSCWYPLLRRSGFIAFTEVSWLREDRTDELNQFWSEVYPSISSIEQNMEKLRNTGYGAIRKKLPALRQKYDGDQEALQVLKMQEEEMELYRRYSSYYGYVFYVAEKKERP